MANLDFSDMHNMIVYLQKLEGSEGFHQIIDFLTTSHIKYALTENPTIYVSLIEQFWQTATTSTLEDGDMGIPATIDEKVKVVSEASIRRHLKLEDFDEKAKNAQAKEIVALKKRVQSLERKKKSRPTCLKRLKKVGMSRRVESFEIKRVWNDELMFDTGVLDTDEMPVDAKVNEKDEQSTMLDDSTAGEAVTTANVEAPQEAQPSISKDKGKGIMIEPEVPLKRKDQIALDEQIARDIQAKLDAELIEEEKLARKQEEDDNIALIESWENTQAMMKADRFLAERLQLKEREELTDEEKGKLFMELIEKRRKHFAALRAQEKRNRPPTKAQKRTQMSTYLKHMGGYTYKQLKGKSFDEIQKLFDKEMKRVNTFVAMGSEVHESNEKKVEGSEETAKGSRKKMLGRKRAGKEQQQESLKKQRMEEDKESDEVEEVEEDDEAELKKHLVIKKDEDIAIDAIPLATKPPVIIDYKLHKEGMMVHYQLIRADGSSKRYSSMIRMLQGIDREDLEALWRLVKTKYGDIRHEDEFERVLWGDLKVMFKPDIRSDVWRNLQGYRVTIWKLIDSSGVHFVRFENLILLVLAVSVARTVYAVSLYDSAAWNGILRKGRKTKPKRQNRTRNGKAWKRQSQDQAQVSKSQPKSTPTNPEVNK
ncbi:hypothetical protein Tco_0295619 [Tanacetum coccineum]